MKFGHIIYLCLSSFYLVKSFNFLLFLSDFECDGFACISLLVSVPIALAFVVVFAWTLFKYLQYGLNKRLTTSELNKKLLCVRTLTIVPFCFVTVIMVSKALGL